MPYGTIKVDNIIFTNGGSDQTVTVSGIVASTSGNLTVTGTISGGTVVAPYGSFTSLTGVTTSGTNANFQTITGAVGVYTTSVSGRAVNALTANIVSGVFASGTAAAPSITFTGNTAAGIYSPGTDQVAISTSGTGRLFVNASGNVGVGTSSPTQSLEVNGNVQIGGSTPRILSNMSGAQSTRFSIQNSTTNGNTRFYLYPNGTGNISAVNMYNTSDANATDFQACDLAIIGTSEARLSASNSGAATAIPITFYTANAEKMRLDSSGRLGLGTSSPSQLLEIAGSSTALALLRTTDTGISNAINFYNNSNYSVGSIGPVSGTGSLGGDVYGLGHTLSPSTELTPVLSWTSGGRVGIGTSSPAKLLHVQSGSVTGAARGGAFTKTLFESSDATATYWELQAASTATNDFIFSKGNTGSYGIVGYDHVNDALRFFANSSERLRIDSSGRVGIGTSSPAVTLDVTGGHSVLRTGLTVQGQSNLATGANLELAYDPTGDRGFIQAFNRTTSAYKPVRVIGSEIQFDISNSEKARIDSSGRLLVGTTDGSGGVSKLVVQGASNGSAVGVAQISYNGLSSAVLAANTDIGYLRFTDQGSNSGVFAQITASTDGTTGVNDYPGRLVFSTTADGAASPTERMRINNTGSVTLLGATSVASGTHSFQDNGSSPNTVRLYNNTDSNNNTNHFLICDAAASVLRAAIRSNGGLANFSANNVNLSDRNAKKDITLAIGTWDCLKEWEIVNFRYKDQPNDADLNLGVIAQQVAESCPEVITVFQEAKEATETEPAQEERLGVKDQQVMWMAIKALQEAMNRIEVLETEVAALKGA